MLSKIFCLYCRDLLPQLGSSSFGLQWGEELLPLMYTLLLLTYLRNSIRDFRSLEKARKMDLHGQLSASRANTCRGLNSGH